MKIAFAVAVLLLLARPLLAQTDGVVAEAKAPISPLPNTRPLDLSGDIASELVSGVDRFLLRKIDDSTAQRGRHWNRDFSSPEAYEESIGPNRKRLGHMLGIKDTRPSKASLNFVSDFEQPALVAETDSYQVFNVRWPAFRNVYGEGLLLQPKGKIKANVVAIPHADFTPEQIVGIAPGVAVDSQYARRLAENGCRVIVPTLVSRRQGEFTPAGGKQHDLANREFLYRPAFVLGRHLIGYELQKIIAATDWFATKGVTKTGIIGWGEGGMLSLYAGALDSRIDAVCVSGHFDSRNNIWQEPIDRNVFGLLNEFGDAELASMIAPRALVVETCAAPEYTLPPGTRGAPARIKTPDGKVVDAEFARAKLLAGKFQSSMKLIKSGAGCATDVTLATFLKKLGITELEPTQRPPDAASTADPTSRAQRQMRELNDHSQWVLRESQHVRNQFMSKLDASSPEKYSQTIEPYRRHFANEVIGVFDDPMLPMNPRTRKVFDTEKWVGHEVVLDVFPDVIAFGILLVPKDIVHGEKRPVVVCQHGLEGRPRNVIEKDHYAYHDYAAKLAERGFITFAPQNLYIFQDRFRTLQRKANCIKKTLFSVIVPQHQQIVNWLKTLPSVDSERIAFYGLSYGGKSAMRIPPLVPDYCLSICSADFNEWVDKNASTRNPRSYAFMGEYEIFEFDLGSTFNYAEMAALIAPRPFMVERGHFDGVADDQTVAWEFAKVRNLYAARLKLPIEHCQIEWFDGPHTINGRGTFEFLHHHLKFKSPK